MSKNCLVLRLRATVQDDDLPLFDFQNEPWIPGAVPTDKQTIPDNQFKFVNNGNTVTQFTVTLGESSYSLPLLTNTLGVPVTYQSTDTSVATVTAAGMVSIIGAGITYIKAIFAGNDSYESKTVQYRLVVMSSSQSSPMNVEDITSEHFRFDGSQFTFPYSGGTASFDLLSTSGVPQLINTTGYSAEFFRSSRFSEFIDVEGTTVYIKKAIGSGDGDSGGLGVRVGVKLVNSQGQEILKGGVPITDSFKLLTSSATPAGYFKFKMKPIGGRLRLWTDRDLELTIVDSSVSIDSVVNPNNTGTTVLSESNKKITYTHSGDTANTGLEIALTNPNGLATIEVIMPEEDIAGLINLGVSYDLLKYASTQNHNIIGDNLYNIDITDIDDSPIALTYFDGKLEHTAYLALRNCITGSIDTTLNNIQDKTKLEVLSLSGSTATGSFNALGNFVNIRSIDIDGVPGITGSFEGFVRTAITAGRNSGEVQMGYCNNNIKLMESSGSVLYGIGTGAPDKSFSWSVSGSTVTLVVKSGGTAEHTQTFSV